MLFDCGNGSGGCYWPNTDHYENYKYTNKTFDDLEKIDQEKIKAFAKNRLAQLINKGIVKPRSGASPQYSYSISITNNSSDNKDIYMFEELRTKGNLNYDLKTFYVKNNGEGKDPTWSYKLEDLYKKEEKNPPKPGDITSPDIDISTSNIQTPVRGGSSGGGGGSSVGGSGSGKGVPFNPDIPISFTIVNEKFKFKTFASDSTNKDEKVLEQGGRTQVTDKISFDKLSVGKEYKFVGKLINKRTGEEVKTENPIVYETGKLTNPNGEASITITFDSSIYQDGDEFVLVYDIFEDGKLAGFENNHDNPDQSFKIVSTTTPPGRDYPPPKEETPPPKEETPPPKEETPPPKEEVPPVEEVEKESPKQVVEIAKPTPVYMAPKTFDPGIGLNVFTAILSGAALTFLRKRR